MHKAQQAMGPCYFEVAQVYIGMCRKDCLPKAMHNLQEDLSLCRGFRTRCTASQMPRARVTEAKTLLSMANVHYQSGDLEKAITVAQDAARVCSLAGSTGTEVLANIEANVEVYRMVRVAHHDVSLADAA